MVTSPSSASAESPAVAMSAGAADTGFESEITATSLDQVSPARQRLSTIAFAAFTTVAPAAPRSRLPTWTSIAVTPSSPTM